MTPNDTKVMGPRPIPPLDELEPEEVDEEEDDVDSGFGGPLEPLVEKPRFLNLAIALDRSHKGRSKRRQIMGCITTAYTGGKKFE